MRTALNPKPLLPIRYLDPKRALDRLPDRSPDTFDRRVAQRELELASRAGEGAWGHMMERALTRPIASTKARATPGDKRLHVDSETRWGYVTRP